MSSDWSETKIILQELEQLFNRDDDIKDILDIKKMEREIDVQCANKLKDAKEIIKGITDHGKLPSIFIYLFCRNDSTNFYERS
jgi:hypothetical protein